MLPLYTPARLIEEICMLDHLSGGRLEVGVGRGIVPFELAFAGVDPNLRHSIGSFCSLDNRTNVLSNGR